MYSSKVSRSNLSGLYSPLKSSLWPSALVLLRYIAPIVPIIAFWSFWEKYFITSICLPFSWITPFTTLGLYWILLDIGIAFIATLVMPDLLSSISELTKSELVNLLLAISTDLYLPVSILLNNKFNSLGE